MRVAWVSRHGALPAQVRALMKMFGDELTLIPISRTFRDAREVFEELREKRVDIAVVVLPLSMLARLLPMCQKEGIELWMAKMQGLHECEGPGKCPEFDPATDVWLPLRGSTKGRHMRFVRFERIKEVRVITEPVGGGK